MIVSVLNPQSDANSDDYAEDSHPTVTGNAAMMRARATPADRGRGPAVATGRGAKDVAERDDREDRRPDSCRLTLPHDSAL